MKFQEKTDDQSIEDFISELQADCFELHLLAKGDILEALPDSNTFFGFLLECSDEPHYKLLNHLAFYNAVNPQKKEAILFKIMQLLNECRVLVDKLKVQSPEERSIRPSAEFLYFDGSNADEIVEEMVDTGILPNSVSNENHLNLINMYVGNFPSFKKLEEMKKDGDFEDFDLSDEDIAQQDDNLRSIIARRELDN